jgi:hypothetical protein
MSFLKSLCILLLGVCIGVFGARLLSKSNAPSAGEVPLRIDTSYELGRTLAFINLVTVAYARDGRIMEHVAILDDKMLPMGLRFMMANKRPDNAAEYFAWRLRKYYHDYSLPIPASIAPILANIPSERPKYEGELAENRADGVAPIVVSPSPETPAPR